MMMPPLHMEPRPGRPHPCSFIASKVLSWPLGCDLQTDPDLSGQVLEKIIGSRENFLSHFNISETRIYLTIDGVPEFNWQHCFLYLSPGT